MAFDQKIEADEPDLGSFLRAPIVGTLLWILGGNEAKKIEARERQGERIIDVATESQAQQQQPSPLETSSGEKMHHHHHQNMERIRQAERVDYLYNKDGNKNETNYAYQKKKPPRLMGSDISDFGECAIAEEAALLMVEKLQVSDSCSSLNNAPALKRCKKMSWSDESGQSLVEYIGESVALQQQHTTKTGQASAASALSSSPPVPPPTGGGSPKPIKSAIKRSRSTRVGSLPLDDRSGGGRSDSAALRYLPRGLSNTGHNGIIMPTKPFGNNKAGYSHSGHVSPEYGFYVNLTPPSPEMYAATTTIAATSHKRPSSLLTAKLKDVSSTHPPSWPGVPI